MPIRGFVAALAIVPMMATTALAQDLAARDRTGTVTVAVAEPEAYAFRKLQSELMVATLSCKDSRFTAHYNTFVTRFRADLRDSGKVLRSYFQRHHGNAAQRRFDEFMTALANDASLASMGDLHFCSKSLAKLEAIVHDANSPALTAPAGPAIADSR